MPQKHPHCEGERLDGSKIEFTVCASCGRLKTILFLDNERWFCVHCRSEGSNGATLIPMNKPATAGGPLKPYND